MKDMMVVGLKLNINGTITDFLGVHISKDNQGIIHLTQPQLIDSITQELNLHGPHTKGN